MHVVCTWKDCSANEVVVGVEIVPDTVANLLETVLVDKTRRIARGLWNTSTIFHVSLLLHLLDGSGGTVLLSVEERVILLRDLETEDGVANSGGKKDEGTHERGNLRSLKLVMLSTTGIWEFEVHILIGVTGGMGIVVSEIVGVHVVVMDETTTVDTLRLEVEADIVPMSGPDFVIGVLLVSEILGERKRQGSGLQEGHLSLEVTIITCVILIKS